MCFYCVQIFTLKVLSTLALSQRESRERVEALVGEDKTVTTMECSSYDFLFRVYNNTDHECSEDGNHILAEVPHVGRDSTYFR